MSGQGRNWFSEQIQHQTKPPQEQVALWEMDKLDWWSWTDAWETGQELAFPSWWLPAITACQLSCRAVLYFLPLYGNISHFQGFLVLCTMKSLNEICALICFQPKHRDSISIGNCKLFYFSRLYFSLQGIICLKFYPSVFHMSQLPLQNLYFRFRCHINQCSHVLCVIIISSKSNIIFQSVDVSSSWILILFP